MKPQAGSASRGGGGSRPTGNRGGSSGGSRPTGNRGGSGSSGRGGSRKGTGPQEAGKKWTNTAKKGKLIGNGQRGDRIVIMQQPKKGNRIVSWPVPHAPGKK